MLTIVNNLLKGLILIFAVNLMKGFVPLSLPLNYFTIATAAVFGIPGVIILTLLVTLINGL